MSVASFAWFQNLVKESLECLDPSVDAGRRETLRDAVTQADTLEELGLLTTLPGLRWAPSPESQMLVLMGDHAALVLVVTRLPLVHPVVLQRHRLVARDGTLYAVMGGLGDGQHWYPLPHSIGRCRVDEGSLEWLDDMGKIKERKYGLLHRLRWQRPACGQSRVAKPVKESVSMVYRTYGGDQVTVQADVSLVGVGAIRWSVGNGRRVRPCKAVGLLPYRDCAVNYWTHDAQTTSEFFHRWGKFFHAVSLPQWVKVRWQLRSEPEWHEAKGVVTGAVLEGDSPVMDREARGWRLRVKATEAHVSDTSGRSMFFPTEYDLTDGPSGASWVFRADYKDSVVYLPNGTMNWLGPGRVLNAQGLEVGVCIMEAHQLQSMDEVIGTTLQLAGFVDRRDDDTRNDWELFRP